MQTPPGWYRDPTNAALERWWDGLAWSVGTRPASPATSGSAADASWPRGAAALAGVVVVLVALIVTVAVVRDGGSPAVFDTGGRWSPSPVPQTGSDFVESNGSYSMRVGDGWDRVDISAGAAWYTGTSSRSFRDNVTVIIEDLPARLGLDDYVELSLSYADRSGLVFDEQQRTAVVLSDGSDALVIDYDSEQQGFALRHRLVVTVRDLVAVSATFTSERDRFAAAVGDVDAYLRTISVR